MVGNKEQNLTVGELEASTAGIENVIQQRKKVARLLHKLHKGRRVGANDEELRCGGW